MSSAPVWDVDATEWVADGCRLTATGVAPVVPLQHGGVSPNLSPVRAPVRPAGARPRPRRAGSRGPRYASSRAPVADTSETLRLTRRGELLVRRVTAVLVMLSVAGVLTALTVGVVGLVRPPEHSLRTVVVQPGESLWQIAEESNEGGDVRDQIERIRSANRLSGAELQSGQRLIVPVG
jgi:LysM domain